MKWFVFRNMTVERLFDCLGNPEFSGYGDISAFSASGSDRYVWAYLSPYNPDTEAAAGELTGFGNMLEMVLDRLPESTMMIAITLVDVFSVSALMCNPVKTAVVAYNARLRDMATWRSNLKIVEMEDFLSRYPNEQWIDWKYYFLSQMPLSPKLAGDFGEWFVNQIRAIELKRKKCLVLDLDNTLWGGILGEDGISGVQIGNDYPGSAYLVFQKYLLELSRQGVILTVCSKNNIDDVRALWAQHPANLIKEEHLAAWRINWQDKAANIHELAAELNIGTDSMVFVDDNPSERQLVSGMLPEVAVPDFVKHPYQLPLLARKLTQSYFTVYGLTTEDRLKTKQYKARAQREQLQRSFTDFDDYLRSLEIELTISEVNEFSLERASQMTQKTNQFNLTTRRYESGDIQRMIDQHAHVYTLSVRDKFGDNGITGLMIAQPDRVNPIVWEIDTLLMSCRILGKNIEREFLRYALRELFTQPGVEKVRGLYIMTPKNAQVADFYSRMGFYQLEGGYYELLKHNFSYQPSDIYKVLSI